ncbi:hypothetical protein GGF40_000406 [Coemansia sp. RSA 1286]|nr:hypothetical protein IWW45_007991 [Coemansia sp. RSA 485]KAJ2602922.1 hypothetical protein GGF39_000425 [Coemansia sp. RSA 1721]KAJ2640044.1 hypothetical protein GGF40_000406 [Coemansia sp. RSA 1286]
MDIDTPVAESFGGQVHAKRQRTNSFGANSISTTKSQTQHDIPKWQTVSENAFNGIVSIRFYMPTSFDGEPSLCSEATGFIVDAERGIILTNRHVVGAGPFVGEAIMHDHEEVNVKAIYRDPIHDFGFLKFDPSQVKYMKLAEINLAPENARVGIDVRVIGNDAGEKLSILNGSISRIDRNPPAYGQLTYNDLNTFYLQAASSLSGGSSGSPVIDINGNAVGLQAGGRCEEATNFFLPLDRVKRALELIQQGMPIPRGTIQAEFIYETFDEVRRMGLPEDIETMVRKACPDGVGMLIALTTLPEGPSSSAGLEPGDVLLRINGEIVTHFVMLEKFMDDNVGDSLSIEVIRNSEILKFTVSVDDMHALTPSQYVVYGSSVVHNFAYQMAYSCNLPVCGVFVADATDLLQSIPKIQGVIIERIDGKSVCNINDFVNVMKTIPDHSQVALDFFSITNIHERQSLTLFVEHQWQKMKVYTRNDSTGYWDCERITDFAQARQISPVDAKFPVMLNNNAGKAAKVSQSIVMVRSMIPVGIEGYGGSPKTGLGVVVDSEKGLVVVSQQAVPTSICEPTITIANSSTIPAKLRFLHPTQNFAILQYNPKHIGKSDLCQVEISPTSLNPGDHTHMITQSKYGDPLCIDTVVTSTFPMKINRTNFPRWRSTNCETLALDTPHAKDYLFGVLADDEGRAQALWAAYTTSSDKSYAYAAMPIQAIVPVLEMLKRDEEPRLRSLNVELAVTSIAQAVNAGLSHQRLEEYQKVESSRNVMFRIVGVEALSKASGVLNELDIIISIDGKPMTTFEDLDVQYTLDELAIVVLRQKKEVALKVKTTECSRNTDKIVFWAGATIQAPYKAVLQQSRTVPSGVCYANICDGSPAKMYGLQTAFWITHINGKSTPDLDTFEQVIRSCPDNTYVRVKGMSFELTPVVLNIKMCYHYFPTASLLRDPSAEGGWRSSIIGEPSVVKQKGSQAK